MIRLFSVAALIVCLSVLGIGQGHAQMTPEHDMLKMDDGDWRASLVLYDAAGQPKARYEGQERNSMIGDLWSVGKLELLIGDQPYVGFATLGYDPVRGEYVGTWVDSTSPQITDMHGTYDAETRTLVLFYETLGPDGSPQVRKNVMVYKEPDTRVFDSFLKKDGAWTPSMSILYERME